MKLDYNILWFEDDTSWYDSIKETIIDNLTEKGFEPEISKYESSSNLDIERLLDIGDFDLILMDYKLPTTDSAGGNTGLFGDAIIERIRRHNLGVEIIFYSQDGPTRLRQELFNRMIDGVYCADRVDFEEFVPKIIDATLKKVQRLNAIRGLVMAEVSDQDALFKEILSQYTTYLNEKSTKDFESYVGKITANSKCEFNKKIDKHLASQQKHEYIQDILCDTSKRARILHKLDKLTVNQLPSDFTSDYTDKVLRRRNTLAHNPKDKILSQEKGLSQERNHNEETYTQLRKDLKYFRERINNLLNTLKDLYPPATTTNQS